jgi:diguanylate cyclase (GGDEF)-like protein
VRTKQSAWKYILVGGFGSIGLYFVLPGPTSQDIAYSLLGAASVVCVVVSTQLHHPSDRIGWYLLAVAGAFFTLGDDTWSFYNVILHASVPFPSFADALYLLGYPFLFAGVLRLTRSADHSVRREDNADAAIVALGALAISWHFLMSSYVHDSTLGSLGMFVNFAYPIMDIALVFILFRTLVFGESSRPFHRLLAAGMAAMFVGDFTYDLLVLHDSYQTGNACDALFLTEYVLVAAAALHPSVATWKSDHEKSTMHTDSEWGNRRRLPIVMFAGFVPPTILIVTASLGLSVNVLVMAILCFAVLAVICFRMHWLIDRISRQALTMNENDAHLRYLAFHDELTGLANRALLYDRIEHALAELSRTGGSVALCFGDLDGFKVVNDTLGHDVGDQVLITVGAMIQSIVRPGDTVARLGGDEFAVLVAGAQSPGVALDIASRIVSLLGHESETDPHLVGLSMSVGVSFADATTPVDQLVSESDAAMYEAKANGRNRVELFEPAMRTRLTDRLAITGGFRGSLERSEYFLEYQPIWLLDGDRKLLGFEALVRWRHPTIGLVPPLDFIPTAEETGFIVPLGRWVLIEACEQLANWSASTAAYLGMSVNVSRRQLVSQKFVDDVRYAVGVSGIDPRKLVLEVTEGVLMENPDRAVSALSELQSLGVRVAVDDFGTGYSSLSHLQRFPADVLKIDGSFVNPLTRERPESSTVLTSIIGLGRSLGLDVVAEGIEREEQLAALLAIGCRYGQGYLMGRPMGIEAASDLIRETSSSTSASSL